jgi:folate-dependent phosphoribosylglycinamide formyltransferase PurN
MPNPIREQKKQQLVYRSQLHRLQLETRLLESRRPLNLASSFMGGVASYGFLSRLAGGLSNIHPSLGRLAQGMKMVSVLLAVAKMLRSK